MKFLVVTEAIEAGPMMPPGQILQMMENLVIPSFRMLAEAEKQGKVTGGGFTGARGGAFILEAQSAEEAHEFLTGLPFWGVVKMQVKPLISVEAALRTTETMSQNLRSMSKPGGV